MKDTMCPFTGLWLLYFAINDTKRNLYFRIMPMQKICFFLFLKMIYSYLDDVFLLIHFYLEQAAQFNKYLLNVSNKDKYNTVSAVDKVRMIATMTKTQELSSFLGHLLVASFYAVHRILFISLIPKIILWSRRSFYPHFVEKEGWVCRITRPRSRSKEWLQFGGRDRQLYW